MIKKILSATFNIVLLICGVLSFIFIDHSNISKLLSIFIIILPELLILLSIIFRWLNLNVLSKLFYCLFVICSICLIVIVVLQITNIIGKFSSVISLKEYILSTKEKGVITYILIQLLQVVFLPIPASVICIVGSLIYGPLLGGIYCCIGVLLGSYISFFTGRIFGYKIVSWIVGKDNVDKYSKIIRTKGMFFLGLAFLLPMFPDDILCFIAGVTKIKIKHFFWVTLITRPIGVICMAYFGSGAIIPFSGWGIYAWIGILILVIIVSILLYKWENKLQEFILSKIRNSQNITRKIKT